MKTMYMQTMGVCARSKSRLSKAASELLMVLPGLAAAVCVLLGTIVPAGAQEEDEEQSRHSSISLSDLFADSPFEPSSSRGFGDAILPRIAWQYNFDDPDSPGDFPLRYWVRMTGSDTRPLQPFPLWNDTSYDPERPDPEKAIPRVFQLETRGGNTGVRLVDGVIPAIPLTDYLIRIDLRTLDLQRARAAVAARFLDAEGKPIESSEQSTSPLDTNGTWKSLSVALRGQHPNVAWIQIDLLLLQPAYWDEHRPVGQQVQLEDVSGIAQFDYLSVWRLPRVELSVSPSNVAVEPQSVEIEYWLQDLARKGLEGRFRVYDIEGRLIDRSTLHITDPSVKGSWSPSITQFGWYRAMLDVYENNQPIARAGVDFAYVPRLRRDLQSEFNPQEFTTILTAPPTERSIEALDDLLEGLGTGRIVLPIWLRELNLSNIREHRDRLARTIDRASGSNRAIALSITELPRELADALGYSPHRVVDAIAFDDKRTHEYLEDFLVRFGQRVERWTIGQPGSEDLIGRRDLENVIDRLDERVSMLVPQPTIELPFPGDFELPPVFTADEQSVASADAESSTAVAWSTAFQDVEHRILRYLPTSIRHDGIGPFIENQLERSDKVSVFVERPSSEIYGEREAAMDLAKRVVLAREAGAVEVAMNQPWREVGAIRPKPMPTPVFPVWRTLREQLAGRRAYGRISLQPGLVAIIFADPDGESGTIVCWNESPESAEVSAEIHLGPGLVEAMDVFGNRTPVPMVEDRHRLTIGRDPVFLMGIDAHLAMFRAGVRLENDFVEAAAVQAPNQLIVRNPWTEPVHGVVRITSPITWRFQPRYQALSVEPGQEARLPVTLTIPIYETAGAKKISVQIAIETPRRYEIETSFLVDLGHKNIIVRPTYSIVPNASGDDDLIVTLEITNRGSSETSIRAFCIAPPETGFPYQHADVPSLAPGDVVERAFIYRNAAATMQGQTMRVGFRGIDNADRLNLLLKIDDEE